jgi:uncharacterized integral membrane protein
MTSCNGWLYGNCTWSWDPIYHEIISQKLIGLIIFAFAFPYVATVNSIYDFFKSNIPLLLIFIVLVVPGRLVTWLLSDHETGSLKITYSFARF